MIERCTDKAVIDRAVAEAGRFFSVADLEAERVREVGRSARRAEDLRLVKASQCPTDRFPGLTGPYFNRPAPRRKPVPVELDTAAPHTAPDLTAPGTWAVVEKRDWCGEQRIRLETRPGQGIQTPETTGDRITAMLTEKGAKKISESCYFMACERGGFSTFATLTLTNEAREKLVRREWQARAEMAGGWMLEDSVPIEPARAKQGSYAPKFTEENQIEKHNKPFPVGGPFALLDSETGRPFTPVKRAYVWSVQKEAGRFFEAASKMYQRGWQYKRLANRFYEMKGRDCKRMTGPACDIETRQEYQPLETVTIKVPGSRLCIAKKRQDKTPQATILQEFGIPFTPLEDGPYTPIRYAEVTWLEDGPYTPIQFKPEPLSYLWVAEAPYQTALCWKKGTNPPPVADENGEMMTNPHLHLMMNWRVAKPHFRHWAARLEKLWGHGFAHLEKIKDPQKAGSYVAKAAGYLSKAQGKSDQGEIRGNRYGISSRARAPGWIETERHQVGMMGWLLAEAHEMWSTKHGEKLQRREKLKRDLEAANDPGDRQKIGRLLEGVRKEIEPLSRISKYAALFKSEEMKNKFLDWATRQGWEAKPQNSLWLTEWRKAQWARREYRVITRIDSATLDRLEPDYNDVAHWISMADSGAVECDNDADYQELHLQMLQA